jgi:hypothetical protein
MTHIEKLANDIAFLSNDSLQKLALELVKHYPTRADVLETKLSASFFDGEILVNSVGELIHE